MCLKPKVEQPTPPPPVAPPEETAAQEGATPTTGVAISPTTGQTVARRRGVRGLRITPIAPIAGKPQ